MSSSSSSVSSSRSLPRAPSPSKSPLETLITHLLASKRSLTSTTHLYRANSICTLSRSILEATVITSARSSFLRRGLTSQLEVLQSVQVEVENGVEKSQREFADVLRVLDESEARLRGTLELLRETKVEKALRPVEETEEKCLLDFVDERAVDSLEESLKSCIDGVNGAVGEVEEAIHTYENDLKAVHDLLGKEDTEDNQWDTKSPIPQLLQGMEGHAKEMADLLESLVRHFDLCVTAIKHTEGGGAAARNITGDLPVGMDVSKGQFEDPAEPITDEERQEMMEVLEKDAAEVEDVVLEIQDRIGEMEVQLEAVIAHKDNADSLYANITTAFQLLETLGAKLPSYISQSRSFHSAWSAERERIREGMSELESLASFYESFLTAYDGLIVEVARRRGVQTNMEKIVRDAMIKLERLHEEDIREREAFKQDQGDFLPSDIWPGLVNPALRWEIGRIRDTEGELDGEADAHSVPEIPRKVVEMAMSRLDNRL